MQTELTLKCDSYKGTMKKEKGMGKTVTGLVRPVFKHLVNSY